MKVCWAIAPMRQVIYMARNIPFGISWIFVKANKTCRTSINNDFYPKRLKTCLNGADVRLRMREGAKLYLGAWTLTTWKIMVI
jgi:hypothetical protein